MTRTRGEGHFGRGPPVVPLGQATPVALVDDADTTADSPCMDGQQTVTTGGRSGRVQADLRLGGPDLHQLARADLAWGVRLVGDRSERLSQIRWGGKPPRPSVRLQAPAPTQLCHARGVVHRQSAAALPGDRIAVVRAQAGPVDDAHLTGPRQVRGGGEVRGEGVAVLVPAVVVQPGRHRGTGLVDDGAGRVRAEPVAQVGGPRRAGRVRGPVSVEVQRQQRAVQGAGRSDARDVVVVTGAADEDPPAGVLECRDSHDEQSDTQSFRL